MTIPPYIVVVGIVIVYFVMIGLGWVGGVSV